MSTIDDLFDEPAAWRAAEARRRGLVDEALMAAVAPGAGFPVALRPLVAGLALAPDDVVLDVGAGLGGASAWLARRTSGRVVAIEPAEGSARGAARLFPDLPVVRGTATALPCRDGSVAAVSLLGVASLLDDLDAVLCEVTRVLAPGGRLAVSDVFSVAEDALRVEGLPNTFRSLPAMLALLARHGLVATELGVGDADLETAWHHLAESVESDVVARHQGDPALLAWRADGERLGALVASGALEVGTLVASTSAPAR